MRAAIAACTVALALLAPSGARAQDGGSDAGVESDASAPPEASATETQSVDVTAAPGRGVTVTFGDAFSANLRARIQVRDTVHVPSGVPTSGEVTNELAVRTLRIWLQGHAIDPHVRYGIQLALGANDFEPNNASPVFDAYLDVTYLRDLSVRVGQYFVPFDRARTIREFALESIDRANVVRELSLDRDVGITLYSNDLFGLGGVLAYQLGVFGGDGRNRIGAQRFGLLYVGRITVRPMGPFDDDAEGDLGRSTTPHVAIGVGVAYNQATDRSRSTTSASTTSPFYQLGGFDYFHLAADAVVKYAGLSILAEALYRSADASSRSRTITDPTTMVMTTTTEYSRQAWGLLGQVGLMLGDTFEIWARYEQLEALAGSDPQLLTSVGSGGRATAGGLNCYLNGHLFKIQADWQHTFADDFTRGEHLIRVQLDATF